MPDSTDFLKAADAQKPRKRTAKPKEKTVAVNLVAGEVTVASSRDAERKNTSQIFISFCAALILVGIATGALFIYGMLSRERLSPTAQKIETAQQKIAQLELKSAQLSQFQNHLESVKTLVEDHIYWTELLKALEASTLPTVTYEGLAVARGESLVLSAFAPDYATVGRQLNALRGAKDAFSAVEANSASAQVGKEGELAGVSFSVTLTLNPSILKKK